MKNIRGMDLQRIKDMAALLILRQLKPMALVRFTEEALSVILSKKRQDSNGFRCLEFFVSEGGFV